MTVRETSEPEPVTLRNPSVPRLLSVVIAEHIRSALVYTNGNRSAAAKLLGIDRRTLYRRLDRMVEDGE